MAVRIDDTGPENPRRAAAGRRPLAGRDRPAPWARPKTPVWNRIRKLRDGGVIGPQTVMVDPEALGFEACFFVLIRTSEHEAEWQRQFLRALQERPEVQEAHRLAGDIDYILKVRVEERAGL